MRLIKSATDGTGGFPALELTRRGDSQSEVLPPHWLNINNQGVADVAAIADQLDYARKAGMQLICIQTSDSLSVPPVSSGTAQLMGLVRARHPTAVVIVRWLIESWADIGRFGMRKQDVLNSSSYYTTGMNSPSKAWAASAAKNFSAALHGLDQAYPGMIAGVQLMGMETGEWFFPPAEPGNDNHDNIPGLFVGDYSEQMSREFCAATDHVDVRCRPVPTASERNAPTLGNALLQWENYSTPSARSVRFNQFLSHQVAGAVATLATAVKETTGNAALCLAFYCYLFALSDSRLAGSGHLACGELQSSSLALDGIVSPYQYASYARVPGGRMTAHGPIDSPTLHGKFWVIEDDTRTVLAAPSALRFAADVNSTLNILRRNAYTAMLRQAGLYWLDLESQGWFGRPDNRSTISATQQIWTMAVQVRRQWTRLLHSQRLQTELLPAEVAIFVDELSAAAAPLLGLNGAVSTGYTFETALIRDPWHALSGIGASVRVYLLSDLGLPNFPTDQFRLCVFLNAIAVPPATRLLVREKLQREQKSLVWVYAPGLLNSGRANLSAAVELTGLPLRRGKGNASLVSVFVSSSSVRGTFDMPRLLANISYGGAISGPVDPWIYADEPANQGITVLARYQSGGQASIVTANKSGYASTFVGCPNPPVEFWRAIARAAGVHVFVEANGADNDPYQRADSVETGGAGLLVLAGPSTTPSSRTITLPKNYTVEDEFGQELCSSAAPCSSFQTQVMGPTDNVLFWLGLPPYDFNDSTV